MTAEITPLIEKLIDSQMVANESLILTNKSIQETNLTVTHLAKSVDKLILDNAIREKNDEYQKEKNKNYDKFKDWSTPIITKAKEQQGDRKKVALAVSIFVIIALLKMFDVDFAS